MKSKYIIDYECNTLGVTFIHEVLCDTADELEHIRAWAEQTGHKILLCGYFREEEISRDSLQCKKNKEERR